MRDIQARPSLRRSINGVLVLAGWVALVGCGDGKIARYPVSGTVLVDGKPADGAMVILCPPESAVELKNVRPVGTTDAGGKFSMTTFDKGDGAPAGEYKVIVQWPKGEVDLLKGRYFKLANSTLAATVKEESNELPPFELTTR